MHLFCFKASGRYVNALLTVAADSVAVDDDRYDLHCFVERIDLEN